MCICHGGISSFLLKEAANHLSADWSESENWLKPSTQVRGCAVLLRWLPSASCSSVLAFLWWCMPEVTIVGCPSISPLVTFRFVVCITGIFRESSPLRCHSYHNGPVIITIAVSSWFYFQGPLSPLPSAVPSSASATTSPGLQERARPELVSGAGALQPLTLEDGIFSETSLKHVLKFLALHLLGDF